MLSSFLPVTIIFVSLVLKFFFVCIICERYTGYMKHMFYVQLTWFTPVFFIIIDICLSALVIDKDRNLLGLSEIAVASSGVIFVVCKHVYYCCGKLPVYVPLVRFPLNFVSWNSIVLLFLTSPRRVGIIPNISRAIFVLLVVTLLESTRNGSVNYFGSTFPHILDGTPSSLIASVICTVSLIYITLVICGYWVFFLCNIF